MILTKTQKEAYLADPAKCPCCGSDNWDSDGITPEYNCYVYHVNYWCCDCWAKWTAVEEPFSNLVTDITLTTEPHIQNKG